MPAVRLTPGLVLFWRLHRWLLRLTNGRIGSRLLGQDVLLLTTLGRKSGHLRSIALYTFPYQGNFVVIASNVGENKHPGWYLNLREHPEATLQVRGRRIAVMAREATGEERERIWSMVTSKDSSYVDYQARTERLIPVMVLEPRDSPSART